MGVRAGASLDTIPYRSLVCNQVASLPEPLDIHDWAGFVRDVTVVRPIAQGFLSAVVMGEHVAVTSTPDLRDSLTARAEGEQTLRAALSWVNDSPADGAPTVSLRARLRRIPKAALV